MERVSHRFVLVTERKTEQNNAFIENFFFSLAVYENNETPPDRFNLSFLSVDEKKRKHPACSYF
jgi:hypothetical protein